MSQVRERLEALRKERITECEIGYLDFMDLTPQEREEFVFLSLYRLAQWIDYVRMQAR